MVLERAGGEWKVMASGTRAEQCHCHHLLEDSNHVRELEVCEG